MSRDGDSMITTRIESSVLGRIDTAGRGETVTRTRARGTDTAAACHATAASASLSEPEWQASWPGQLPRRPSPPAPPGRGRTRRAGLAA